MATKKPVPVRAKKPREKLTPTKEEQLKLLLADHAQIAEKMATLKAAQDSIKAEILAIVSELDGAGETWEGPDYGGRVHRATVVRPMTTTYDEDYLASALPPRVWKSVTDTVLNVKALEEAVTDGRVDPDIAIESRQEVPRKPYVRITSK